jgi:putative DNA primase/helicase
MIKNDQVRCISDRVKEQISGKWDLYMATEPRLNDALHKKGKHVPCPIHGGKDGFRFFPDMNEKGAGICNTCGYMDGFTLLMKLRGIGFYPVVCDIADFLEIKRGAKS